MQREWIYFTTSNASFFKDVTDDGHPFIITIKYTEGTVERTVELGISVGQGEGFDVEITRYYGSKMNNGTVESFNIRYNTPVSLHEFEFDTSGIVPGIEQTVEIRITNTSIYNLDSLVYIKGIDGD